MRRTGRTRKLQRALALILSASLVLDPQTVAAMETDGAAAQEVSADDPQEAVWQEESLPDMQDLSETAGGDSSEEETVWPVEEVESYRQANEKQYRMSDGSMEVRIYPEAVHYEQDGVWLDIDNTLYATEDGTYENGANSYQAVFSDGSGEQEDLVTYREGEYEISWKMVQEQNEPGTDEVDAEDPDEDPDENQASEEQEKEALDDGGNSEAQEDSDEEETSEVQETPDAEFEEEKEQSEKADEAETDEAISEDEEEASEDQKTPTEEETSEEATTDEEITDEDTEPAQDDPLIPVWPEETSLSEEGTLLTYSGMEEGINLTYEARPASLKESILVEGPQEDYRYQFLLTLKGLSAELTESGDVELSDGGQVQYRIPAPYMEDAEGNTSWDAGYTLEEQEDGTCLLTVEADRDWMEEAAWPVLIDPVLEKEKKAGVTDFVTVRSDGQSEKSHKVGMDKEIIYRTYLRFDLPELPRGAVISKAVLDTGGGTMKVKTFQVPGDCAWEKEDPDGEDTITWENQPFKPGEPVTGRTLDYATPDSDFVITRAVREWYAGKANHGIVFLSMDETKTGTVLVSLPTSSAYLKLTYRAQGGLTSYWSTHDFAAGAAGEGHIRDFNGGLTLLTEDVSSEGLRMPLSLSHVYQSELAGTEDPLVRTDPYTRCGDGWKLSVMQTLEIPYRETDLDDYAYVYTDSDGSRHYFKRGNATYLLNGAAKNVSGGTGASYPSASDEDGLGLFVVPVTEAKLKETYPWKIVNKSGSSSLYFDRAGRLGMVTDANQKENGANASTKEQNRILYTYEAVENGDRGGQAKLEVFRDALADLKAGCKNENWQELLTEASTQAADLKENCPLLGTNYKAARQFLVAEQNIKYLVDTPTAAVSVRTSKTTAAVNAFALVLTELEGAGEVYDQRLVRIEDAVGKATTLAYNEDGLLASVTEPSDETVRMQYQYDAEGRLTEILDSREQAPSAYSYTEQGLLSRITDPDGYQISLEWEEDRVSSLEESVPEGDGRSSGQAYTIQHGTDGTVHYRFSGPDDIPGTEDDIENVYSFDEAGKTLSVYSTPVSGTEIIGASVYTYTDGTTEGPNKIKESAQTGRSAVNLLQNHSFEYKDDTWTLEPGTGAKDSLSAYSTKTHYIGKHAAMFSFLAASGTTERSMAIREDRSLSAGTYTISGYLKTDKLEGNLGLAVRRADGETWKTETVGDTTDVQMNNGWQRVQTAFTLEEDAEVEIRIEVTGISGNAWADCLQLEEGILANPYNILEDGSFELTEDIPYQSDSKPSSTDKKHIQNEVTDSISTDGHHSYHITAEAASTKSFSFLTEVGSESSSYILSGWYKSTLTPERNEKDTENGRYLMASAYYHGTDTADSVPGDRPGRLQQFYWLPSWPDGWTYFSFLLAQGAWNELRVTIKVQGLEGDLYLDGMQLVKNEVQTRKYTNTGKLTSRTVQAKTSTYTYDYERLKTEKTPGGNVSTYTYDNISSDVKQVTRSVGPGNYYTYDQYGNTVSESVYKSGPELYTRTFYTEDGNFRTGIADTRGNESQTEYDPNTGLLLSQTDPNGNKTAYTYNEKQLLTRTSHTDADGTSTENDYLYDGEDRLTGITHNGFSYQFQYDSFGNSIGTGITGTDGKCIL